MSEQILADQDINARSRGLGLHRYDGEPVGIRDPVRVAEARLEADEDRDMYPKIGG